MLIQQEKALEAVTASIATEPPDSLLATIEVGPYIHTYIHTYIQTYIHTYSSRPSRWIFGFASRPRVTPRGSCPHHMCPHHVCPSPHDPSFATCKPLALSGQATVNLGVLSNATHLPFAPPTSSRAIDPRCTGASVTGCGLRHFNPSCTAHAEKMATCTVWWPCHLELHPGHRAASPLLPYPGCVKP